jgi:competence ComEA-like helix-hairpin-helix protein
MSEPVQSGFAAHIERRLVWPAVVVLIVLAGLEIAAAHRRPLQVREPTVRRTADPVDLRLDLNAATAVELEQLPGIGKKRAGDIVAFRERYGPFRRAEDVMKIKGIKDATFRLLEPYVRVLEPAGGWPEPGAGDGTADVPTLRKMRASAKSRL